MTRLAIFRWTNNSPGSNPTISLAGTLLSEQPIQRYSGACCATSLEKNSGLVARISDAHFLLFSMRFGRSFIFLPRTVSHLLHRLPPVEELLRVRRKSV